MTRAKFSKKFPSITSWLYRNNRQLFDSMLPTKNPKPRNEWTTQKIIEEAKRFKTPKEWREKSGSSYSTAKQKKILHLCQGHMEIKRNKWSVDELKKSAAKYSSRSEWRKNTKGEYYAAIRLKLLDVLFPEPVNGVAKKVKNLETGEIYKSIAEADRVYGGRCISNVVSKNAYTAYGYRWAYCDEKGNIIK